MSEAATLTGARLKAERERRGLSAQKAADEMHLDRWVIDALEAEDYQRIGPAVYAKGHLKKYAALLGLPAAEIMAGYEQRAQTAQPPAPSAPSMMLRSSRDDSSGIGSLSPWQIAAGLVVAVLIIGVVLWKPWHQRAKAAVTPAPVAAVVESESRDKALAAAMVSPADTSPVLARDASSPVPTTINDGASAASAPAAAQDPGTVAGAGRARLRLSFSADSWVDVHDAAGKRTYSGNGLANSVKVIAGTAPMRVYLGFGSGVQLEINDRVVAIGPQFFAGDVARFEAGADGVLRRDSRSARPPG
jgi:cytoskeleton protein RodZ